MFILVISVLLVNTACQKAQRDEDNVTNTCEDMTLAQMIYSDAYLQIRYAALHAQGISAANSTSTSRFGCEEITVDTLSDPKTITIDFKYLGCTGMSVERSGRLVASFFGEFPKPKSAVDIEFSNYYFQDFEVGGKIRAIFKQNNASGHPVNTFYLQDGFINDGTAVMSWTASQEWELLELVDEVSEFSITGTTNGINRKGNVFFSNIQENNVISDDCLWIKSGTAEVEILNLSLRLIDYGSGVCDRTANAVINGSNYTFIVPQ